MLCPSAFRQRPLHASAALLWHDGDHPHPEGWLSHALHLWGVPESLQGPSEGSWESKLEEQNRFTSISSLAELEVILSLFLAECEEILPEYLQDCTWRKRRLEDRKDKDVPQGPVWSISDEFFRLFVSMKMDDRRKKWKHNPCRISNLWKFD